MSSLVQIDGSLGEGGGQVLRIALCLSALYGIPIEIKNIRAGRPKPGLAAQHLKGVELAKKICNANVKGGFVGSTHLEFRPGQLNSNTKEFVADTQTAGCIGLLAQVAIPCALFLPHNDTVTFIFKGGTNVPMGPHIEYLKKVFRPMLNKFGADFDVRVLRRGYYPHGNGEVHLHIRPVTKLNAVTLIEPGIPQGITGKSYVAGNIPINMADKMVNDAKGTMINRLTEDNIDVPLILIEAYKEHKVMTARNGSGINIACGTNTGCAYGGSGLGPERSNDPPPGVVAANGILNPILAGACVDDYMQDQMIILMILATGISKINIGKRKLTGHTETAMQVAKIMLDNVSFKLESTSNDISSYILECHGLGR